MFSNKFCVNILTIYIFISQSAAFDNVFTTIETIIANSSIKSTNQPCEDFYSYACGSYKEQHSSNLYHDIISYVDYQYNSAILNLLETSKHHRLKEVSDSAQTFVEKTSVYLKACRHETKRNLTKYLEEIKPGLQTNWPIVQELENNSNQTYQEPSEFDFDVWSLLGKLQSHGLNDVLIYKEILMDRKGEISIMMAPFENDDKTSLPDIKVLHVLLLQMGIKSPAKIINQLRKTHKILLNILENTSNNQGKRLEMTFGDLGIFYPNLNLSAFLCMLMDRQLPADTFIVLRNPSYFQYLNDNLWLAFEKPNLSNYLILKFLYFLAFDGSSEFKSLACVKDLRNKFDLSVNFLFQQHIFSKQSSLVKPDIEEIFTEEVAMLSQYIKSNYLELTKPQIDFLMDKLAKVRLNIGNLPENVSLERIEKFYEPVPLLDETNYYKNHLIMLKHRFANSLFYAPNQSYFIVSDNKLGSTSGAFYVSQQNMIILPFASLMKPLYDFSYNKLTKYSLLGFILGHELAHAFDTNGLNFNGLGQPSASIASVLKSVNLQNSLKCLQKQHATDNIDEVIGDLVAIQIIKKILTLEFKNSHETKAIWKKFFFLFVAQIFCNKNNIKYVDHDADGDRLNQIVKNFEGFSQVFECSQNSKMNDGAKCRIY